MADNIGQYVTYEKFVCELDIGGTFDDTERGPTTLSAKVVDAGGDIYTYVPAGLPAGNLPVGVGDVLCQQGFGGEIIAVLTGPDRIQINKTGSANKFEEKGAFIIRPKNLGKGRAEELIQRAMDFIDAQTGQFFNKRTGIFTIEGSNSPTMMFGVPIIEITTLLINSTTLELFEGEDKDFFAFKSREQPTDDRRNPMIKLNVGRGRENIFSAAITNRIFSRNTLTTIEGSFGFLELSGITPPLIEKATMLLASVEIGSPVGSASTVSGTGPLKRVKVDIHEKEFFELKSSTDRGSESGIKEVDQIMAKYRTPIRVGGSFQIINLAESNRSRVFSQVVS